MRWAWGVGSLCLACSGSVAPDASVDAERCAPSACDDGLFCNGVEVCADGACAAGVPPCTDCDEASDACACSDPDRDDDDHDSIACGGDDCDDADPGRNPDAAELCDPSGDEDCDESTIGASDVDLDGFIDAACCNGARCGDDCDDADGAVGPGAEEPCDGVDNDCDGAIDGAPADVWCNDATRLAASNAISASCIDGSCAPTSCVSPYLDCSSAPGCESDPTVSADHCGACGTRCSWVCDASECVDVVEITAGWHHTCARRASGVVDCWGDGRVGQLGNGIADIQTTPVAVVGLSNAIQISGGFQHTCARWARGRIACWGYNMDGQLGDGTTMNSLLPVAMIGTTSDWAEVASGRDLTCARRATGGTTCWISSIYATGSSDAVEIDAGENFACARRTGGGVACWGYNDHGQLGDGTTNSHGFPLDVIGIADAVEIAAGGHHVCARRATGAVMCWGDNTDGQLGDGSTMDRHVPAPVPVLRADIVQLAAGTHHTCALRMSGAVQCWGLGANGRLGDGTDRSSSSPVTVARLDDAIAIAAGGEHTCALRSTGEISCWGSNDWGQLGDGTRTERWGPVRVIRP